MGPVEMDFRRNAFEVDLNANCNLCSDRLHAIDFRLQTK